MLICHLALGIEADTGHVANVQCKLVNEFQPQRG
jgi:hypothetical protein